VFRLTFLGHNGWLLGSGKTHLLVDPLLHDHFGATQAVGLRVYPPRQVDLSGFPNLDAIVLTHEHEDHFDVPSLCLVDRRVPVYVPARSSTALTTFLKRLGFKPQLLRPGKPQTIGALELLPLSADQVGQAALEEWDVLPFIARDRAGGGSFFTHVDIAPAPSMWQAARRFVDAPGLWTYTCNNTRWSFTGSGLTEDPFALARFTEFVTHYHERMTTQWARAAAVLVVGASYAFDDARAWLNRNVFPWTSGDAQRALAPLVPEPVFAPAPGETFFMRRGKLVRRELGTAFVRTIPETDWPARDFRGNVKTLRSFQPATGRRRLPAAAVETLDTELDAFAAHLYAGGNFRSLYSLDESELGDRRATFALALYNGRAPSDDDRADLVYEYVPQACAFRRVQCDEPRRRYAATYECWASDLLAYLRCELSPTTLYFAYSRSYNALPRRFRFDLNHALFEYVHPLRQPARCLARYERLFEQATAAGVRPMVGVRSRPRARRGR
jgi:hypothetical protein